MNLNRREQREQRVTELKFFAAFAIFCSKEALMVQTEVREGSKGMRMLRPGRTPGSNSIEVRTSENAA
jgi:hypothetical protein